MPKKVNTWFYWCFIYNAEDAHLGGMGNALTSKTYSCIRLMRLTLGIRGVLYCARGLASFPWSQPQTLTRVLTEDLLSAKTKKLSWLSRVWPSEDCKWTFTKWVSQLHLSQALLALSFCLETLQTFCLGGPGYLLLLPPELLSWAPASDSAGGLPACGEWTLMAFIALFPVTLILQRASSPKSCWTSWPGLKGAGWRRHPC